MSIQCCNCKKSESIAEYLSIYQWIGLDWYMAQIANMCEAYTREEAFVWHRMRRPSCQQAVFVWVLLFACHAKPCRASASQMGEKTL